MDKTASISPNLGSSERVYEDNDVTIIDESESLLRMLNKSVDL